MQADHFLLPKPPSDASRAAFLMHTDSLMRRANVWTDVQKNNLVLATLCSCSTSGIRLFKRIFFSFNKIKNASFEINTVKKELTVFLHLNTFWYLFGSRIKIAEHLSILYSEYVPDYKLIFKFQKYKKKSWKQQ